MSDGPSRSAVFFDVDGTLVKGTIVHYYVYLRKRQMPAWRYALWYPLFLLRCVYYLVLDKIDRSLFNRRFYASYANLSVERTQALAQDCFAEVIRPRMFEHVRSCVQGHRAAGRMVVLLTGSVDFIVAPLAADLGADATIAVGLTARDGRFTGDLDRVPLADREKANALQQFAREHGIDLASSFAYADSIADLDLLECVGHPNAVNPDKKLEGVARMRGWPIHRWQLPASSRDERA